jgi:hypothetical protein
MPIHFTCTLNSATAKFTHGLADFALGLLVLFALAAVPFLFALGESDFTLRNTLPEVDLERYERQPFVVRLSDEFFNLRFVQQELARPQWRMVKWAARQVFPDMAVQQPDGPGANYGIGVSKVRLSFAQRFHFGAKQHHTCLLLLKQEIIVRGGAILGNQQLIGLPLFFDWLGHRKPS